MSKGVVCVNEMNWVLDPTIPFKGPVKDGGTIVFTVSPGCWGAMITPDYASGHEVTVPVGVEGAEVGDAVALHIKKINVLSLATTSGTDKPQEGNFEGDPFVAKRCPTCHTTNPQTYLDGIGEEAIKCTKCKAPVKPFIMESSYTILMDEQRKIAVTVPPNIAEEIANEAAAFSSLPAGSKQYSANVFARGEMPGVIAPLRPMVGNIGSCPAVAMPSSHNAGDFGSFLIGAPHKYALTENQLEQRTDAHMDINEVVEGSTIIVPVKVSGGGIYAGDVHAMMGDGELAGHTTDVSAEVIVNVSVIKGLNIDGPLILPLQEDLPKIVRPRTEEEILEAKNIADIYGFKLEEEALPIQVVGTGKNLNEAVDNGLNRMAKLFEISIPEVRNRCTITGQVDIGRLPGVVQISMLVPSPLLKKAGLWEIVKNFYAK